MGADLHIHVFERITEESIKILNKGTLGSKYFEGLFVRSKYTEEDWNKAYKDISNTPNIWIGSVSWLKANLMDDDETYVPNTVGKINEIIGEDLPILDDVLEQKILATFDLPNTTNYDITKKEKVAEFLSEHKGKKLFTVSW